MYKKIFSVIVLLLIVSVSFVLAIQGESQGDRIGNQNTDAINQQTQNQSRIKVQDGTHVGEEGQMFRIQTQENNRIKLESKGVSAECSCEIKQEKVQNKTKLYARLSNGENAEVKIMPNVASERALERLRLKTCSEENDCQIDLKEVGSEKQTKLAYEIKTQRQSKIFGLFKAKMNVQAQVNAENGEIIRVKKPWWAFLAFEPAEE